MHSYVAFLMYPDIRRCSVEELTPDKLKYIKVDYAELRKLAKNAGFAINYGGNGATIAKNCNIPKADGEFVYNSYFEAFPGLKNYFDYVFHKADLNHFIEFNRVTRRKYFFLPTNDYFKYKNEVNSKLFWVENENPKDILRKFNTAKNEIARLSQNYPIQGSASDITKYACILFYKEILKREWWGIIKMVNLVHDEIVIEFPKELQDEVVPLLVNCMKEAGKPFCPVISLGATADIGDHWIH